MKGNRQKQGDKNKVLNRALVIVFCVVIFSMPILRIILPEEDKSYQENRLLAKFPSVNANLFLNKELQEGFDKYVVDHFPLRVKLIDLYGMVQYAVLDKKLIKGIYVGEDGYLFSADRVKGREIVNEEQTVDNFRSMIKRLSNEEEDFEFRFLITNSKNAVYEDKLPKYIYNINYRPLIEKIININDEIGSKIVIDTYDELVKNKEKQVYYKGDTHWNMHGAYLGYKLLMDSLDIHVDKPIEMEPRISNRDFDSNPYKTGAMEFNDQPQYFTRIDEFKRIQAPFWYDYYYYYDLNYDVSKSKQPIDDRVAISVIKNPDSTTDKRLLIFHDSYSQLYEILLAQNFREIITVQSVNRDKLDYDYVYSFINKHNPDVVVLEMLDYFLPRFVKIESWNMINTLQKVTELYDTQNSENGRNHIDNLEVNQKNQSLYIRGWGIVKGIESTKYKAKIVLYNEGNQYEAEVIPNENASRITAHFLEKDNDTTNYDTSRFKTALYYEGIESGKYNVGILINADGENYFIDTKNVIEIAQ